MSVAKRRILAVGPRCAVAVFLSVLAAACARVVQEYVDTVRAHGSCVGRQCRIMDVRNAAGRIAVVHDKVHETVKTG